MMKHIFITLLFLTASFSSLAVKKAKASEYDKTFITHEKFVMLSAEDRREVVIKIMEYMVSSEGQSKFQEVVQNGTPEEKAKWKKIVQVLGDFFISSAQAQDPYASYSSNYIKTVKGNTVGTDFRCIYGGWISKANLSDGVCTHPSKVKNRNGNNLVAYDKKCPTSKNGIEQISCNPVIFGFESGSQPFCASAYPAAHNSSLECMTKSLGKGKEARLDAIAENLAKNPEIFHTVMEFIFYTCACDPSVKGDRIAINEKYHEYMRPHRTCYGLLNQMKNILNRTKCEPLKSDENFQTMLNFLNGIQSKVSSYDFEAEASKIAGNTNIGKEKNQKFDDEFGKAINEIYAKDPKTQAFCKAYLAADDGEKDKGGIEVKDGSKDPVKPVTPPGGNVGGGDIGGGNKDKAKSCKIVCEPKVEAAAAEVAKTKEEEEEGKSASTEKDETKKEVKEEKEKKEEEEKPQEYTCKKVISIEGEKEDKIIPIDGLIKSNDELKDMKHEDMVCEGGIPGDDKTTNSSDDTNTDDELLTPSISSKDDPEKTIITIKVLGPVKKDPKDDKAGDGKKEKDPKGKDPKGKDPEGKDGDKAGNDYSEDSTYKWYKKADKAELSGDNVSEQPRGTEPYEVCAEITPPEGMKISKKEVCATVPALETKAPANSGQNGQNMVPQRQKSIHINFGIR